MKNYQEKNKEDENLELEIIISDTDSELMFKLKKIIATQKLSN